MIWGPYYDSERGFLFYDFADLFFFREYSENIFIDGSSFRKIPLMRENPPNKRFLFESWALPFISISLS